jgi:hypothetical protein
LIGEFAGSISRFAENTSGRRCCSSGFVRNDRSAAQGINNEFEFTNPILINSARNIIARQQLKASSTSLSLPTRSSSNPTATSSHATAACVRRKPWGSHKSQPLRRPGRSD